MTKEDHMVMFPPLGVGKKPPSIPTDLVKANSKTLSAATSYVANSEEDYAQGGELLKMLTAAEKRGEEEKQKVLKPLLEATKKLREFYKPFEDKLKACKDHIKKSMLLYNKAQQVKAEEEKQRLLNDGRIKKQETLDNKIAAIVTAPTENTRQVVVLVVTDTAKIPREFFDLNETRLKVWLKEGATCEGAHLEKEQRIVSC